MKFGYCVSTDDIEGEETLVPDHDFLMIRVNSRFFPSEVLERIAHFSEKIFLVYTISGVSSIENASSVIQNAERYGYAGVIFRIVEFSHDGPVIIPETLIESIRKTSLDIGIASFLMVENKDCSVLDDFLNALRGLQIKLWAILSAPTTPRSRSIMVHKIDALSRGNKLAIFVNCFSYSEEIDNAITDFITLLKEHTGIEQVSFWQKETAYRDFYSSLVSVPQKEEKEAQDVQRTIGVVCEHGVYVRSSPTITNNIIGMLKKGETIEILELRAQGTIIFGRFNATDWVVITRGKDTFVKIEHFFR